MPPGAARPCFRLPNRRRRTVTLARTLLRVLLRLLTIGALVVLGFIVALYLGGATWIVNRVLQRVDPFPDTSLQTARVSGNLLTELTLHDVRLIRADSQPAWRLDSVRAAYDPRRLFGNEIVIRERFEEGSAGPLGVDRVFGRGTTPGEVACYLVHALVTPGTAPDPRGAQR